MSFFNELRMAATDLANGGLNLDTLREEIGNETHEPLPPPPPRRGQLQAAEEPLRFYRKQENGGMAAGTAAAAQIPPTTGSREVAQTQAAKTLAAAAASPLPPPPTMVKPPTPTPPVVVEKQQSSVVDDSAKKSAAPTLIPAAAAVPPPATQSSIPASSRSATPKKQLQQNPTTLMSGLRGKLDDGFRAATSVMSEESRVRQLVESEKSARGLLKAAERDLESTKKAFQLSEAEKREQREEAVRLETEVQELQLAKARSDAELSYYKSSATESEKTVEAMRHERDACAAELEAVALREVDALQAEVASLRRHKARADRFETELETLKSTAKHDATDASQQSAVADDLRRSTISLEESRKAAAASARASRALIESANGKVANLTVQNGTLSKRNAELERRTDKSERELSAALAEISTARLSSSTHTRRSQDTDELRGMLRDALFSESEAKKRASELEAANAELQEKTKRDLDYSAGELAAAREAARDARKAIVDRSRPCSSDDDEGSAEYLRTLVRTALPANKVADAATRNRLHPVLRSLLSLTHEAVVDNLDALALTGSGGDFALALLANADARTKKIISAAEAKVESSALTVRVQLLGELEDAHRAHFESKRQLAALAEELELTQQQLGAERGTLTDLEARVELATQRSEALQSAALAAQAAAEDAVATAKAEAAAQTKRRAEGLDAEQLEYLRSTLVRYLSAAPTIKKQLSPVLLNVLKLAADDDHAVAILNLKN